MKNEICFSSIISILIFSSISTCLNDSILYCKYLDECEIISKLQEKLCLSNTKILTPYWLPSDDPIDQHCYIQLRNRYQMLKQLMHESSNQLLSCMTENIQSISKDQKENCDQSLFQVIKKLTDTDGKPLLTNCFQGSKRFKRQCGPLIQCCGAYHRCKEVMKQSSITKQLKALIVEIQIGAKKCEENIYHQASDNTTSLDKAITDKDSSSTFVTFTNDTENDDLVKSFLQYLPNQRYMFLKSVLIKETKNLSIFRRHNTTSHHDLKIDKNNHKYQTLPNKTTEIKKLNDTKYNKVIEEYRARKEEYSRSLCGGYMQCRRQVEKSMDRCQIVSNNINRTSVLSTTTLIEMANHCIDHDDNNFNKFSKLVLERDNKLHGCFNTYHNQVNESMNCSINHIDFKSTLLINEDSLYNATDIADCLNQVNLVQLKCDQLRKCCPNFYRCRDETFDAKVESQVALLTAYLIAQYNDCVRHELITMTMNN